MANTFTTNYSLTKSEVGANNDNWGTDLNNALTSVDGQIVRKVDKTELVTQTSNKIAFASNTITANSSTASTLFQNFQAGDVISIAGSSNSGNNGNHTISSKTNAYTLVTGTSFTTESEGTTLSYHLVPKYSEIDIDGGTVNGATITGCTINNNVTGDLTGNVTGNTSGSSGSCTGNSATATALATGRNIILSGDVAYTSTSFTGAGNATGTATIQTDAVTTAKILNSNVTDAKISAVSASKLSGQVPDSNLSSTFQVGGSDATNCKHHRRTVFTTATTATSIFTLTFSTSYRSTAWIKVTAINRASQAYSGVPSVVTKEFVPHYYSSGSGASSSGSATTPTQSTPHVFTESWSGGTYTFKYNLDSSITNVPGNESTADTVLVFDIVTIHLSLIHI